MTRGMRHSSSRTDLERFSKEWRYIEKHLELGQYRKVLEPMMVKMVVKMVVKCRKRGICSVKHLNYAEFLLSLQQIP